MAPCHIKTVPFHGFPPGRCAVRKTFPQLPGDEMIKETVVYVWGRITGICAIGSKLPLLACVRG